MLKNFFNFDKKLENALVYVLKYYQKEIMC